MTGSMLKVLPYFIPLFPKRFPSCIVACLLAGTILSQRGVDFDAVCLGYRQLRAFKASCANGFWMPTCSTLKHPSKCAAPILFIYLIDNLDSCCDKHSVFQSSLDMSVSVLYVAYMPILRLKKQFY